MSHLPIDLDTESVQFDGAWYTRDDLARRIKAMLDSGDFAISRPSAALEQLTSTLASLRTLAFRAPPEMADALNAAAARQGKTVGSLIREAVTEWLGLPALGAAPSAHASTPAGKRPTDPEVPVAAVPTSPIIPLPASPALQLKNAVSEPPPVPKAPQSGPPGLAPSAQSSGLVAGPGAIAASAPRASTTNPRQELPSVVVEDAAPEDAAGAVDLNVKKKDEEAIERRWFGG